MKEWFKARNIWGGAIISLSDAEAGRLAKALWSYTMTGEEPDLSGAEKAIFAMFKTTLDQDSEKDGELSEKRRAAGSLGGKQKVANQANATTDIAKVANATFAKQNVANVGIKNKKQNKNQNKNSNSSSNSDSDSDELKEIAQDHEEIFNALSYAGFPMDSATLDKVVDLYVQYGKEKVLSAIDACVENSVKKVVYLKGVLESREKELTEPKPVPKEEEVRWLN